MMNTFGLEFNLDYIINIIAVNLMVLDHKYLHKNLEIF